MRRYVANICRCGQAAITAASNGEAICPDCAHENGDFEPSAPNARTPDPLVAELVEALEAAIKCHDSLCRSEFEGTGQYEPMLAVLASARTILAKAKGDGHVG